MRLGRLRQHDSNRARAVLRAGELLTLACACWLPAGFGCTGESDPGVCTHRAALVGEWGRLPDMATPRITHTVTLLRDGRVFVASGSTYEIYDPAAGRWLPPRSLPGTRTSHSATRLEDGRVLLVGGIVDLAPSAGAWLYDPATDLVSVTGSMSVARRRHAAARLATGEVLVAGGWDDPTRWATAELYDPVSGTWRATGTMSTPRLDCVATRLLDGRGLVIGGTSTTSAAETYDRATETWTTTGPMAAYRENLPATLLLDGRVLVAGGQRSGGSSGSCYATAELFDPTTDTWTATGSMTGCRNRHTATLIPDGRVLVAGGRGAADVGFTAELYDPVAGSWSTTGSLLDELTLHQDVLLPTGFAAVIGGSEGGSSLTGVEQYDSGAAASCRVCGGDGPCMTLDPGAACGVCHRCDASGTCVQTAVGTPCGPCGSCDVAGACTVVPVDDPSCGTIDCDLLDDDCMDYADRTTERCLSLGVCRSPNTLFTCTSATPRPDGTACPDSDLCNGTETCIGGVCSPGPPRDCSDDDPCTIDDCWAARCRHTVAPDGASCDDGDACNGADTCLAGSCTPGTALDCDDHNVCSTDRCDPSAGCLADPVADDTPCDDGDLCNGTETCLAGSCTPGTVLDCDDLDECTADTCTASGGCDHAPSPGAPCDDGDPTTTDDRCGTDGSCAGTPAEPPPPADDGCGCRAGHGATLTGAAGWLLSLGLWLTARQLGGRVRRGRRRSDPSEGR